MIDTHAHLDACEGSPDELLERARYAGVDRVLGVGSGVESCRQTLALAERYDGVFAVLGLHPHQAGENGASLEVLRDLLSHERAVGVGETGLDFFRDYAPRASQLELFRAQLALAAELRKPVVVHTRAAEEATAEALAGFPGTVVLHCFSSPALLETALERRYYVSFAGNVTYPRAEELRASAARLPCDRILVETDSPYLAPQPRRGRPNEPANVVYTVAGLAAARGESLDELAEQTARNASEAFGLS